MVVVRKREMRSNRNSFRSKRYLLAGWLLLNGGCPTLSQLQLTRSLACFSLPKTPRALGWSTLSSSPILSSHCSSLTTTLVLATRAIVSASLLSL